MNLYNIPQYREDMERVYRATVSIEVLKNSRVLVTGATGLLGSFLVDCLTYYNQTKSFHCEIFAACRSQSRFEIRFAESLHETWLHWRPYELEQPITWNDSVDYVIHCAGSAHPAAFMENPVGTLAGSLMGVERLLDYSKSHGGKRFLMVSSGEVYGMASKEMDEFHEIDSGYIDSLDPRSCYPMGKRAAETMCASYLVQHGVETVVARLCHTYGPTALQEDSRVVQTFLQEVLDGRDIIMKSAGEQYRSWCHVADAVSGVLTILLCGKAGQAYNVATAHSRATIKELAELVAKLGGRTVQVQLPMASEVKRFNKMPLAVLASDKLEALGWRGQYSLEEGIGRTWECKIQGIGGTSWLA